MKKLTIILLLLIASFRMSASTNVLSCSVFSRDGDRYVLNCSFSDQSTATILIVDSYGNELYKVEKDESFAIVLNLGSVEDGEYTITVKCDNFTYSKKIIK